MQNWEKSPILSMLGFGGGGTGTASAVLVVTIFWFLVEIVVMKIPLIVGLSLLHQEILWLLRMGRIHSGRTRLRRRWRQQAGGDGRNATGGGGGGIAYFEVPANGFTATTYPVTVDKVDLVLVVEVVTPIQEQPSLPGYSVTGNGGGRGADWDRGPQASPGSGGGFDTSQYSLVLLVAQLNPVQTPDSVGSATMG